MFWSQWSAESQNNESFYSTVQYCTVTCFLVFALPQGGGRLSQFVPSSGKRRAVLSVPLCVSQYHKCYTDKIVQVGFSLSPHREAFNRRRV